MTVCGSTSWLLLGRFVLRSLLGLAILSASASPKSLDHSAWDRILRRSVSDDSLVDYRAITMDALPELDQYLTQLAAPWPPDLPEAEAKAAQINAYNALTVRWITQHYPVISIWKTPEPFKARRHTVNGKQLSLDELETSLRQGGDPRIHAALVCAARSCPPLRAEAYRAEDLDAQLEDNTERWLANPALNEFSPERGLAEVSPILQWYEADFQASGGVLRFLSRHAPKRAREFLEDDASPPSLNYKTYHWGLNDTSDLGKDYDHLQQAMDRTRSGDLFGKVKDWFLGLGDEYGVNPVIFGAIYVGAIPFFSLSIGWLIRNLRRRKSPVVPLLAASFCFVSAYLYLLIAGKNIPTWVYAFVAVMVLVGIVSTVRKVRSQIGKREAHEV